MVPTLIGLIVLVGAIAVIDYLLTTYAPGLGRLVRAVLVAAIAVLVIRILRDWLCGLFCS
jgi:hypothetical protein